MGNEDPRRLAAAVSVLVLALGLLGFQISRRVHSAPPAVASTGAPGFGAEGVAENVVMAAPSAVEPIAGVEDALRRNPFLRPVVHAQPTGAKVAKTRPAGTPQVTAVRTGQRPTAIIDDRTRTIGDTIHGWRLVSIERDRVTLERSDGRTIDLVLR